MVFFVNRTNLVHKYFLICLLFFSTCFGQLCAHHQEKKLYLYDTWYFSLYIDDCLVCRPEFHSGPHTTQHNTTQNNTKQHNTTQHNTTLYYTILYYTILYDTIQHNTTQHKTTQHNTILYYTILYYTIRYNTTQYNTIQYNFGPHT